MQTAALAITHNDIVIKAANGETATFGNVSAERLKILPLPMLGCAPLRSEWTCVAEFSRDRIKIGGNGPSENLIAFLKARLGLKLNSIAHMVEREKGLAGTAQGDALSGLDALDTYLRIKSSRRKEELARIDALRAFPELWRDRIEQIVEVIRTSLEDGKPLTVPHEVESLLAYAAEADFRRAAGRLVPAVTKKGKTVACKPLVSPTYMRLGIFGAEIMPYIAAHPKDDQGELCAEQILMLCHAGPAGAGLANELNRVLQNREQGEDRHLWAHNALLRIGKRDMAFAFKLNKSQKENAPYEAARKTMHPGSSSMLCGFGRGRDALPSWMKWF